jgi:integrase
MTVGRAEIWKSLRTDSRACAVRRLPAIAAQIESEFERLRLQSGMTVDLTLLKPSVDDLPMFANGSAHVDRATVNTLSVPQAQEVKPTLGEVYQRYIDDPTHAWTASTRQAYETTRALIVSILGADTAIAAVSRAEARELVDVLLSLPRNATKLFPKLSPRAAAQRARAKPDIARISAANANAYLGNFSTFMNWCVSEELIGRNPARGLRLPDEVAKRDKRHPFSPDQLKLIFDAPLYTGCQDGERGYTEVGSERPRNARFWVPLIALHTGMRLNEICQLDTTDIRIIDGIACIVITKSSMIGTTDKTLKTGASDRIIPLHPTLIDLGLVVYATDKRNDAQSKLFEEIDSGTRGVRAVAFSKWFTQFIRAAGAQIDRTSFHSFRHNFRDELRIARVDHDIGMALGGWVGGPSQSSAASESYGRGHRIAVLFDAISRLRFTDIDLSHLRR